MKSKIKFNFRKKIWRLKEEFKTSNRRNDTNQVVTIEAIIKKNNIIGRGESTPYYRYGEDINNSLDELSKIKTFIENGITRKKLQDYMKK